MKKKTLYVCPDCGWSLETEARRIRCGKCGSLNLERKLPDGRLIKADADETDPRNARLIHTSKDGRTWVQKLSDGKLCSTYESLKAHVYEEGGRLADRADLDELDQLAVEMQARKIRVVLQTMTISDVDLKPQVQTNYEDLKREVARVLDEETKLAPYQVKDLMVALDTAFKQHGVDWKLDELGKPYGHSILKPQVPIANLFLVTYTNNRLLNDNDQPTLQGILLRARDITDAHEWAKEWEKQTVNMDADVELQKVSAIHSLEELLQHPEILVQTEALNRR
jgi:hypothetical protein